MRYLVIGGSQRKNQVIGVRDIPTGRCPGEDRERLQIGIQFGWDLADGIVLGRFLAAGANSGESLIDPVFVALQERTSLEHSDHTWSPHDPVRLGNVLHGSS